MSFTGHRPKHLPDDEKIIEILKSQLYFEILTAIQDGANCFYTGMADGIDTWAGFIVHSMRDCYPYIRLIGAEPFPNSHPTDNYLALRACVDEIVCISDHFYKGCYQKRNQYLVENCHRLIAVMLNPASGTGQTVRMAQSMGRDVRFITLT